MLERWRKARESNPGAFYGQPFSRRCTRPCRTLSTLTTFGTGDLARSRTENFFVCSEDPYRMARDHVVMSKSWSPSFDLKKLGKGTGFEPAQRHCRSEETRFLRQVTNPLENTSDSSRQPVHPKPATVFDLCHTCSVCR
jgi:hypothetical protein